MKGIVRFDTRFDLQGAPGQMTFQTVEEKPRQVNVLLPSSMSPIDLPDLIKELEAVAVELKRMHLRTG